jgi:hypothetical protein
MSRDDSSPVPNLDLAPKLNRPLSLWNPLDYLRLLYWVFFFPQAVSWYEKKFGNGTDFSDENTWKNRWQWLKQNPIQQQLISQSLLLLLMANFGAMQVISLLGIAIKWSSVIKIEAVLIASSIFVGVFSGIPSGVVSIISLGITNFITMSVMPANTSTIMSAIISGTILGLGFGISIYANFCVDSMPSTVSYVPALGISFSTSFALLGIFTTDVFFVIFSIFHAIGYFIGFLRLDNWCWITLNYFLKRHHTQKIYGSITFIPIPGLSKQIGEWLEKDWQNGQNNVEHLLRYTRQFIPVYKAVESSLAGTSPDRLLIRTSQIANKSFNSQIVKFASASLKNNLQSNFIDRLFIIPKSLKQRFIMKISINPRLDTNAHAASAGFWYLYDEQPLKAQEAFAIVRNLHYGEEMWSLSSTFVALQDSSDLLPSIPPTPHLRPVSWLVISSFHCIIADLKVVEISISKAARSFALNHAIGELNKIQEQLANLEGGEKFLIFKSFLAWRKILQEAVSNEVARRQLSTTKSVHNPYIIGDPVQGLSCVGREDILNQLCELWLRGQSVQSVVLFGHRRMGKTSILRNVYIHTGASVRLAYVNLLLLSNPQGEADVLMFICDEIQRITDIEPPSNSDFAAFPENTCRRYIQQVCDNLDNQKLIIALDEFEQIENFIRAGKISPNFLQFLRGLVQLSPKIAFAFAGLHTLEEMTADYFHPFFASVIPIRVGFLSRGSTRQLLANPDPDFLLDYQPDTLDAIYDLTAGQPYLTQLVGFQLVRHYNNQVFERGRPRDPVFTTIDLQTVIEDPEFFDRGRYYFTGIWQQAAQDTPHQQTILKAIAPAGLTLAELSTHTNLALADLQPALTMLDRHDVICYKNDRYYIAVELFRRWVLDRSPAI